MKELKHGQQIRSNMDQFNPVLTVGTAKGYDAEGKKEFNLQEFKERAKRGGWLWNEHLAWVSKASSIITANYPGKDEEFRQKAENYKNAVLIEDQEIILIDGLKFKAVYIGIKYSDPIHLILQD